MSSGIAGAIYSAVGIAIGGGVLRLIFAALVRRTDRKFEPGVLPHRRMLPNHRLVASPLLLPLPQRSWAWDRTSCYLCHMLVCCGGTCGVVGDAPASSKRSGKSTGCCWSDAPPPARPASTIVIPNTIRCATSRRHSFIRR